MQQSQFATGRAGGLAQSYSRIMREYREITAEKNTYWTASPVDFEEPSEWHFTVKGPTESDFDGGVYHGRVILPQNYPFAPPHVMLLTPNGRFEVGKKICLSASNYHPELWQPAWGIRSLLDALHAFFPTPGEGALHSLDWPADVRRKLAKESVNYLCSVCGRSNLEIVQVDCLDSTAKRKEATACSAADNNVAAAATSVGITNESGGNVQHVYAEDPSPAMSAATTRASAGHHSNDSRDNFTDVDSLKAVDMDTVVHSRTLLTNNNSGDDAHIGAVVAANGPCASDRVTTENGGFWSLVSNYFMDREGKDIIMWAADFLILIIVVSSIASFVDLVLKPPALIKNRG